MLLAKRISKAPILHGHQSNHDVRFSPNSASEDSIKLATSWIENCT
jgi:hypothetical protein